MTSMKTKFAAQKKVTHSLKKADGEPKLSATGAPSGLPIFLQRASFEENKSLHQSGQLSPEISAPEDPAEREAAHVAERVMEMSPTAAPTLDPVNHNPTLITNQPSGAPPDAEMSKTALNNGGSPIPPGERAFFEPRLGQDLSHVRVHTDSRAAEGARSINAQAFTHGQDIYFGAGRWAPGTRQGRQLIAHELAHIIQAPQFGSTSVWRQVDSPAVAPADNSVKDEQLLRSFQSIPGMSVVNYASALGGLVAWGSNYPKSFEEMQSRTVRAYGRATFDKVLEKDAEIFALIQQSELIRNRLEDLRTSYIESEKRAAELVVEFYTGYSLIHITDLQIEKIRGFYELDYEFFVQAYARNPATDLALLGFIINGDVDAIIETVQEKAELVQSEEDARELQRREWAAIGAKVLGSTVAKKQGLVPWDTNINLESLLEPDYGGEDAMEMLAVARMSGLTTAVVKVENRYYAYKLDEQYDREDLFLLPDKEEFMQILPFGDLANAVYAITANSGYVIRPPDSGEGELYEEGQQKRNPEAYMDADVRLIESGRVNELGITSMRIFQSMLMNLALVNLNQAEIRMRQIIGQMQAQTKTGPEAGDRLKQATARLRQIMLDLERLADEVGNQELSDEQLDRRDKLFTEAGTLLQLNPAAGLFVENTRDPENREPVEESDIEDKIAEEDAGNAALMATEEAQNRLENIQKVRRAIFDDPSIVLGFESLHEQVMIYFSSGDRTLIKLNLVLHTIDGVAARLGIAVIDLVLFLAGYITGGSTWVGLGVLTVGAGFSLQQLNKQIKEAQLLAAMSSLDIEGGFSLARKEDARSSRNWAIISVALNFFALVGLARTASRLFASAAREANLIGRIASRAGVAEDVLTLALRRNWRGVPSPDIDALRKILLAGMDPTLARRYQNLVIRVLSEEEWIARFGPNSASQAVTNFSKSASGGLEAQEVLFRRTGNIFALQEEAAHIQQAIDPQWAQKLNQASNITPEVWNRLSSMDKLRAAKNVLEIELDAQEKLLGRAQAIGDTESMDDAFAHMEDLTRKLGDIDEKLANPASNRYLSWFEPTRPPSIFATPRLPRSLGEWSGVPGNSIWQSTHPDVKSITGNGKIRFRNYYPNFSQWSKGQINLGEMSGFADDFAEADAAFAKGVMKGTREVPPGFTREDFIFRGEPKAAATKLYRQQAGLTWHHHQGGKIMMLVPTKLHANIPHTGGASSARIAGP
jgi:hypothetical protein